MEPLVTTALLTFATGIALKAADKVMDAGIAWVKKNATGLSRVI
jgi:hypothetical protein